MTLLIVGISHQSAPITVLESVALDPDRQRALQTALYGADNIDEVVVLSTCNRTEIYTEARTFHGALGDLTDALSAVTGLDRETLRTHLYVHYEDSAVEHAFTVAAGLDSMAVGESQILGQLRCALAAAQERGHVGPALNVLLQQALRVGKRVHSETGIDSVSHSLVETGLQVAGEVFGSLEDCRVLILGAGGMGALAATTAVRSAADVTVLNRTPDRAARLADRIGAATRVWDELDKALAEADIVISSTGAIGPLVTLSDAADAQVARAGRPQVYVDLALPHDVAPEVAALTGVRRLGLEDLGRLLATTTVTPAVEAATALVAAEARAFRTARAGDGVAPTVTALRERTAQVVTRELSLLHRRTPHLDDTVRAELDRAVHRIVDKLLHTPTTRVKELASSPGGVDYAAALSDLFDLPRTVRDGDPALTSRAADVPDGLPGGERS